MTLHRPPWTGVAACRDVDKATKESFFSDADQRKTGPARKVCEGCPVRGPCLDYAIATGEVYGIWGGKDPRERYNIARARSRYARRMAS